jgi:RNA polymerase sigma factor (sigma-70 family)
VESATASIARLGGTPLLRLQTDERLAALAAAGEERAFDLLARRYRGSLVRACQRLLPPDQAEDAAQQALLNAHQSLMRNGPPERFRPWLHRIATNAALKLIEAAPETAPLDPEGVAGAESPEAIHERRERTRTALAAVAALPAGQRRALVARELEGRSHDEIARELGLSGGAVRQLIYRARHAVRSAASALLPVPLITRLLASGSGGGAQLAELASQGAGGAGTAAKIAAVTVIAGGLAGGAAVVTEPGNRGPDERSTRVAESNAGTGQIAPGGTGSGEASVAGSGGSGSGGTSGPGGEGDSDEDGGDNSGPGGGGDDGGQGDDSGEGGEREHEGSDDDSSGHGSSNSGSGSSGDHEETDRDDDEDAEDEDSSGPSESSGNDSSGSGSSQPSSSGSSGTGSSGSGSSGSGSSGSGSSGSGSSGSGSSGSGS